MLPPVHHYSQVAMARPRVRERERERARLASARVAEAPRLVAQQLKASRPEDLIPNCDRVMYISVGLQSTRQKQIASYFLKKEEILSSPSQFSCKRFVHTDLHENLFVVNNYNQDQDPPPHLVLLDRLLLLWLTVLLHLGDLLPPSPAIVNLSLSLSLSP